MRKLISFCLMIFVAIASWAQQPEAYRLFDSKGKPIAYDKIIADLAKQDVVFFGEMHNDPINHWLEYKVLNSLCQSLKGDLSVGMEMFESDNQLIIDEYMKGLVSIDRFEDECRLWPNYSTDYKPIFEFAEEHHLPFVATNVPRRYASMVKEHGLQILDSLNCEAKLYLPQLPIDYETNEQATAGFALMSMMGKGKKSNPEYMGQAQGLKDATMAWFIAKNMKRHFIHFNGNYHSDSNDGIVKYLLKYRPGTKVKTIYSVKQDDISSLDETYLGHGDYYICVPSDMVTSY